MQIEGYTYVLSERERVCYKEQTKRDPICMLWREKGVLDRYIEKEQRLNHLVSGQSVWW